jgi:hypothetical protein
VAVLADGGPVKEAGHSAGDQKAEGQRQEDLDINLILPQAHPKPREKSAMRYFTKNDIDD